LCTDKQTGRHLGVNTHHDLIHARRQEAGSEAFKEEMQIRAGIEGAVSEIVWVHGARHARFRGSRKNQLQALFVAAATNLKRLARYLFLSSWTWEHHWRSSRSTA
jgi:IS5 family transposase